MTALRPHPTHKPSLEIMLRLRDLPNTVLEATKHQIKKPEENKGRGNFSEESKEKLFIKLKFLIESGMDSLSIFDYLEEHEMLPTSESGRTMKFNTLEYYILEVKRKFNLFPKSKSELIIELILKGGTRKEILRETKCSPETYFKLLVAIGKKKGTIRQSYQDFVDGILLKMNIKKDVFK